MRPLSSRLGGPVGVGGYLCGLIAFSWYSRASLEGLTDAVGFHPGYWEYLLSFVSSPYALLYWVLPLAILKAYRVAGETARPEYFIRYQTPADWVVGRAWVFSKTALTMVSGWVVVGLLAGIGLPVQWGWSAGALQPETLRALEYLPLIAPVPILALGLQVLALLLVLVTSAALVFAGASQLERPTIARLVAIAIPFWGIASMGSDTWLTRVAGVTTYALPVQALVNLPFGSGGGIMVLVAAACAVYALSRWLQVRRRHGHYPNARTAAFATGLLVLAGLGGSLPVGDPSETAVLLLQGVGLNGVSLQHYLANVLLCLAPAIVTQREFVDALGGRRIVEMIRMPTPARWFGRHHRASLPFILAYGGWVGVVALALTALRGGLDAHSLAQIALWAISLVLQIVVLSLLLALGTLATKRVVGGAYAVGVAVFAGWPLGDISRWSPTGQASLLRFYPGLNEGDPTLALDPIAALIGWTLVLVLSVAITINRTRGEIE